MRPREGCYYITREKLRRSSRYRFPGFPSSEHNKHRGLRPQLGNASYNKAATLVWPRHLTLFKICFPTGHWSEWFGQFLVMKRVGSGFPLSHQDSTQPHTFSYDMERQTRPTFPLLGKYEENAWENEAKKQEITVAETQKVCCVNHPTNWHHGSGTMAKKECVFPSLAI